ncbi:hypothetical protein N7450_000405 [Penicillium hetheringtonii]|uniref:N-acetyltransferase domain-containing protein n=1 Tax=Penicillium hetheringtonii TaxID=911720 RepID=A0AAD6E3F2_9EURO|nr:hypothetical protein N7450_000405 [Penicillium hetheringtonii]
MAFETARSSSFPPGFCISTSRLNISLFDPDNLIHTKFLVRLWNTDDFIDACGRTSITTPEKASSFIRNRLLLQYKINQYGMFLVSLKNQETMPDTPIGTVSLMKGSPPDLHYTAPDIGFAVLPEHSGKGYAAEAANGVLEWAKFHLGMEAVFGFCDPLNQRSRRVLDKIGMEFRGITELHVFGGRTTAIYVLPGMSEDLAIYGLIELNT